MIARLKAKNFMGIALAEYRFPPRGGVFEGSNGAGKTSALKAIRAALLSNGVGPDAIRIGEEKAEIVVDLDDVSVIKTITKKGGSLVVLNADGVRKPSPQTYLTDLLGVAPLDPIDLVTERDPKKRRARILSALPVQVTDAQLQEWTAGLVDLGSVLGLTDDGDLKVAGSGIDVVETVRAAAYEMRTAANKTTKAAQADHDAALAARDARAAAVPGGVIEPPVDQDPGPWAERQLASAQADEAAAFERVAQARARRGAAAAEAKRAEKAQARVVLLREQAAAKRATPPPDEARLALAVDERAAAYEAGQVARDHVAECEAALNEARRKLAAADVRISQADAAVTALDIAARHHEVMLKEADALDAQVLELEAMLAAPDAGELESGLALAIEQHDATKRAVERTRANVAAIQSRATAAKYLAALRAHQAKSEALDDVVDTLTRKAPAQLLAAAGIPGLAFDGDTVLVDGVSLDRLSGMEQLVFSVRVARALNAKSKLLVVDGLEALDDEQRARFLELATADGYQLICTRVTAGPVHLVPIGGAS